MKRCSIYFLVLFLSLTVFMLMTADTSVADKRYYTIGTHPSGSLHNILGLGIAETLSANLPQNFDAVAVTGPMEWMPMMITSEIDLGVCNSWDSWKGWLGGDVYGEIVAGGFPVRGLMETLFFRSAMLVAADSNITTMEDLQGKRVPITVTGAPSGRYTALSLLANVGLTEEDVIPIEVSSYVASVEAVMEGRSDTAGPMPIGMGIIHELDATRGARFLSLNPCPEAIKAMQEYFPGGYLSKEVYPGEVVGVVDEPIYFKEHRSYLLARKDLSEEMAYNIVKTMMDNLDEFREKHAQFKDLTPETFLSENFVLPIHEGAITLYQERGLWTPEMQERQERLLQQEE